MATRYQFVDDSGETRLAGFLVPEPGGSSPVTRATYNLAASNVASDSETLLTWAFSDGDALLNLSDPLHPVPVNAGTYAILFTVLPLDAPVAASATVQAVGIIDNDGLSPIARNTGPFVQYASVSVSLTLYNPAGSDIGAYAQHTDTGQTPDFAGLAIVQRLS